MQKKIALPVRIVFAVFFSLFTNSLMAQWIINSSFNLESNCVGYTNVVIDNALGVKMAVTPSLLLPPSTGSTGAPVVYPLEVNGTTVLWDASAADNIRNIIGLSPAGGIANMG